MATVIGPEYALGFPTVPRQAGRRELVSFLRQHRRGTVRVLLSIKGVSTGHTLPTEDAIRLIADAAGEELAW